MSAPNDEPAAKRMKNNDEFANLRADVAEPVKLALMELDELQHDLDKMSEAAAEEILRVEQSYNKKRTPIYEKRKKLTMQIDNFWQTAFLNHHLLSTAIPEEQEGLLSAMRDLEVQEFDDLRSGFKIVMKFDENDFFENDVITKSYHLQAETPSTQITEIQWKPNKKPPIFQPDEDGSITFLEWLSYAAPPDSDEIAEVIKDDLFMNPLQYYVMPDMQECDMDEIEGFVSKERGLDENGQPIRGKRASNGSSKRQKSDESEEPDAMDEDGAEEVEGEEVEGEEEEGEEEEVEDEDAEEDDEEVEGVEGAEDVEDEEGEEEEVEEAEVEPAGE